MLTPTFYDADYHEVKSAAKPGRYGAIVQVKTANGLEFKRFVTLFRTPKDLTWKTVRMHTQSLEFPVELGLDPATVAAREKFADNFLIGQIRLGMSLGSDAAVLFAGLSEIKSGDAPMAWGSDPRSLDQKWWYGLKKQTGDLRTDYYVHLPADYGRDPQKKWPLLLFLHGAGQRGSDIHMVKSTGLPHNLDAQPDFPFVVIAPQCSLGEWWSLPELHDLLDRMEAKYRVDTDRVYLTGLSMGGYGSWALAADKPERFAAIVPICGGGDPDDAERLKNMPIWVFHGGKDPTVPLQRSQEMVDALQKVGGNVKFTIFPEAEHDSWTQAYALPELYTWLLQQHRNKSGE